MRGKKEYGIGSGDFHIDDCLRVLSGIFDLYFYDPDYGTDTGG